MSAKILVVDDETDVELLIRQIFRKKIRQQEFEFVFASNGVEALETVRNDPGIDLVLTDINMPEMDGLTFIAQLRDLNLMLKPVIITAYGDMDNVRRAMNRGAFDFLTKPLDVHELEFTIDKSLQHVRQSRDNLRLQDEKEAAKEESKAKSVFLASMSHEIRTPLNAIVGMTDLLNETDLDESQSRYVSILDSASEALLALINDILDLSKIEAGRLELENFQFNLIDMLEKVIDMMSIRCSEKGLVLTLAVDSAVPRIVIGDPTRIRQVLINLVGNAVKFTDAGEIRLEVAPITREADAILLHFAVVDTGIGIPEDRCKHIFESFSQVDSSVSRKYGGTGLGLSICERLIFMMAGRIWVDSTIGAGSSFQFEISLEIPETPDPELLVPTTRDPDAARLLDSRVTCIPRLRILLVDDSEHNRIVIQHYLKTSKHEIVPVENGELALTAIKESTFDLVFMDMQMPVMDGYTATAEIRKWEIENGLAPKPIIGLTAVALRDEVRATLDAGCTETLTKPVRKAQIVDIISKYAGRASNKAAPDAEEMADPGSGPHTVRVSSELEDIVGPYLSDMNEEVEVYRKALAQKDYETIRIHGHRMRGSGGAYGFEQLTDLGRRIEAGAVNHDDAALGPLIDEFTSFLGELSVVYE